MDPDWHERAALKQIAESLRVLTTLAMIVAIVVAVVSISRCSTDDDEPRTESER